MKLRRRRLARRLSQLTAAAMVAPMVLVVLRALMEMAGMVLDRHGPSAESTAWSWLLGVPALAIAAAVAGALERPKRTRLRLDGDDVVTIDPFGDERFRRADILSGVVTPTGVDLLLRGGETLRAELPREEAEALLEALSLGPARRRAELTLGSENRRLGAGCLALPISITLAALLIAGFLSGLPLGWKDATFALFVLAAVLFSLYARRLAAPADLVIGADAVTLHRAGLTRRIPLSAIRKADTVAGQLVLELVPARAGAAPEVLRLPSGDAALAWAAAERIRAAQRAAGHSAAAIPDLDPAGRSLASWREALARLRRADGEYRRAQVRDEELLAVLQDGQAPAKLRIGAALALREGAAAVEARTKVRIAADTCADEELRAALEAAAAEEVAEGAIRRVVEREERG
jgi:hypothetical protein